MKALGWSLIALSILFASGRAIYRVSAQADYDRNVGNYWNMADRASTIEQKSDYICRFYGALNAANLNGTYDALFFPTPSNSFDENMNALKSLMKRLDEIKGMDPNSFEYQTAMQQITSQEQGEAHIMLDTLANCWFKENYYSLWNNITWISFLIIQLLLFSFGGFLVVDNE